jgi:hypothetical protein
MKTRAWFARATAATASRPLPTTSTRQPGFSSGRRAKGGRALRTDTTFHNTLDFKIGKRLHNLPALRPVLAGWQPRA